MRAAAAAPFLDCAGLLVVAVARDQRVLLVNDAMASTLGRPVDAIVGQNWFHLALPAQGRDAIKVLFNDLIAGRALPVEYYQNPVLTADGGQRTIAWHNTLLRGPDGGTLGTFSVGKDVTGEAHGETDLREAWSALDVRVRQRTAELARANAELRLFREMAEHTPLGVCVMHLVDPADPGSLTLTYINPAAVAVTGIPLRRFIGQRLDVWGPFMVENGRAAAMAASLRDGKSRVLDVVHYGAGALVAGMPEAWFETRVFPVGPGMGGLMIENVTARFEAQQAATRLREALQVSNRELRRFAYVASHDLQEPLRKIRSFGERLRAHAADTLDARSRDYLDRMQGAAERMHGLIDDLLRLSRLSWDAPKFETLRLHELVESVVGELDFRIEASGAVVDVGDLPEIHGDPAQLRRVLQNLISNGLKFQPPGQKPRVWITAAQVTLSSGAPGVEITVRDNGIGFDNQFAERIFSPFQRLHGRSEYEGTGIGLAICRTVAERHQGTMSAHSVVGEGSVFVFRLPVTPLPPAAK